MTTFDFAAAEKATNDIVHLLSYACDFGEKWPPAISVGAGVLAQPGDLLAECKQVQENLGAVIKLIETTKWPLAADFAEQRAEALKAKEARAKT
jgi:hypothetical protein